VTDAFRQYEFTIQRLHSFRDELNRLDTTTFETEREELEAVIFRVDQVAIVEKHLGHLRTLVRNRTEALEKIEIWKMDEYTFDNLIQELGPFEEMNLADLLDHVEDFEYRVSQIDGLRRRLEVLKGRGFDDELAYLDEEIMDLSSFEDVENEILKFEIVINNQQEDIAEKKQPYVLRMATWEQMGYHIDALHEVLDNDDLDAIKAKFTDYENRINRIKKIEKKIDRIPMKGFESMVEMIRRRVKDPENIDDVETAFMELWTVALKTRVMTPDEPEPTPQAPPNTPRTLGDLVRKDVSAPAESTPQTSGEHDHGQDTEEDLPVFAVIEEEEQEPVHGPPSSSPDGDTEGLEEEGAEEEIQVKKNTIDNILDRLAKKLGSTEEEEE